MLHRLPQRTSLEDQPRIQKWTSAILPGKHPEENKNLSGRTWELRQHNVAKERNTEEHEAVKNIDAHEAVKNIDAHEAVKNIDAHEAVKNIDAHEAVKNIDEGDVVSGHSQSIAQGSARENHVLTSHTEQKNGDFSLAKRWRVHPRLTGKFVWGVGQHLTNNQLSITRCFCVEELNIISNLWEGESVVNSLLQNTHPECPTAVNGDTVISGFTSKPADRIVSFDRSQANKDSLVKVFSRIDTTNSLTQVCHQTDEPKTSPLITGYCETQVANREPIEFQPGIKGSFVNVCLQSQCVRRESRLKPSLKNLINIHHPRKDYSQEYNIRAWRTSGFLVNVQHIYRRKSYFQAASRINTREKHITRAALRHVKYTHTCSRGKEIRDTHTCSRGKEIRDTHTCSRGKEIRDNDKYMNTHVTQFAGASLRDKAGHRLPSNILRLLPKVWPHLPGTEDIPSCLLNLNTNAGISDTSEKTEATQASCTSVHSSDQYFSTHTDTPDGKVMDSDNELSPSLSFTEEGADKNVVSPHSNPDPAFSSSCDQVIKLPHVDKERRTESETSGHRSHRKNVEEASNGDKYSRSGQGSLGLVQDDHQASKHKKKTKTTETVYIKFESSMSKKVTTTTTVLKDGKRPGTNKSRADTPKQLPGSDEGQRAISHVPEKVDNRLVLDIPRHTKIVRCAEGHQESCEELTKSNDEMLASGVAAVESKKTANNVVSVTGSDTVRIMGSDTVRIMGSDVVPPTGSDDHLHHMIAPPLSSSTSDSIGKSSSVSERMPSQTSPTKSHAPQSCLDARLDLLDSDYPSERESSAATIINLSKDSPITKTLSMKEGKEQSVRIEGVNKLNKTKPSDYSLKEMKVLHEKRDQSKHISPHRPTNRNGVEIESHDNSHTSSFQLSKAETPQEEISTTTDASCRKRSISKLKGDSFQKRPPASIFGKHDTKKCVTKVRSRTADDLSTKEDPGENLKGKVQQQSTCGRKRSPGSSKTQSRSPEAKRRKRSVKKNIESKCGRSPDYWKLDRSKRGKSSEKPPDKKKKKRKMKLKATGKSDSESSDQLSSVKKGPALVKNHLTESGKTSHCVSSCTSAPQAVEVTPGSQQCPDSIRKYEDSKVSHQDDMLAVALDTDNPTKCREIKIKHRTASSAENVSMSEESSKPIRAAESVPTFTGTVYTSITKVVQVASCPKVKKSEKDLQQAELGWNSSMVSAEEKAAVEKMKQNQRRIKARYYLMKSKANGNECETATAKARRPMPRRNHADGDNGISDKSDTSQPEKTKYGQGKSVQFSESTEKHEASKDETADEYSAYQERQEKDGTQTETGNKFTIVLQPSGKTIVLPQPINKPPSISLVAGKLTVETAKPANRSDVDVSHAANKPTAQKKEESRSQTTPPRKRRPVWQKKASKEKALTNMKAQTMALKTAQALLSIKQRQSSDNILKPSGRLHLGFFCPGRSKMQSPSNISLGDKRTVAYNTWINSSLLAGPMNKATRKLVAKTGSPVDIREIIEGSSVDAADYHKSMRALHEMGVRAAKSVPALGPRRTASTDVEGSRRMKPHLGGPNKNKVHESSSARSLSSVDGSHEQGFSSKHRSTGVDSSVSPASSTDVDNGPGLKYKGGSSRFTDQGYRRKKKDKHGRKLAKDASGKWHVVNAQDVHSVPDLTRVQFYGDDTDLNSANMGLSWVVHSVFSRLPFLNQRQASSSVNASGDMTVGQFVE